jgi:hypothetical protein
VSFEDLTGWNILADLRLAIFYLSEVGSGILLNILMIIGGGGLLALAEWGRRLSLGVAWLKIVRQVAMAILMLVLVLPITTERTQKVFAKMEAQIQAKSGAVAMRMTDMARIGAIWGAITAIVGAIIACIYPGLMVWFLTRPRARAACLPVSSKPGPPEEAMQWS